MTRSPYWRDYLARERTMCAICRANGEGWVRIGEPIPPDLAARGRRAAWILGQRAAFRRHVAERHPDLSVRWSQKD